MNLKIFLCNQEGKINEIANFTYLDNILSESIEDEVFNQVINDYAQKHNMTLQGSYLYQDCEAVGCFFLLRNDWWEELTGDFGELLDNRNVPDEIFKFGEKIYNYALKYVEA